MELLSDVSQGFFHNHAVTCLMKHRFNTDVDMVYSVALVESVVRKLFDMLQVQDQLSMDRVSATLGPLADNSHYF